MRLISLLVLCFLCTLTQAAYATEGGEGDHTFCNGVGNPNSYCDGTEGDPEPPVCEDDNTPPTVHNHVCIVPTRAVESFLDTPFVFNSDVKTCERQCKTVAKTCSNVAKSQGKCFAGVIRGAMKFSVANCKTLTDKLLAKQCQAQVRNASGVNSRAFKTNTAHARTTCTTSVSACVAACK